MVLRSPLASFYFKEKFCVSAHISKSIARCLSCLTLPKKLYLQLYFIQIVHSYGKMLFLAPNNCTSLTFFKEKLCVSTRVSKSLAWIMFTRVEKMLPFGCVCCMKMGLKHVSLVPFDCRDQKIVLRDIGLSLCLNITCTVHVIAEL